MTHAVELDPAGGFVRVTTEGLFDEPGFCAMVDDLIARPFWRPGLSVLVDHRALSFEESDLGLMRRVARYHALRDDRIGDGKTALVVTQPADFGTARQFQALLATRARARFRIFRDLDEALSWLSGD